MSNGLDARALEQVPALAVRTPLAPSGFGGRLADDGLSSSTQLRRHGTERGDDTQRHHGAEPR